MLFPYCRGSSSIDFVFKEVSYEKWSVVLAVLLLSLVLSGCSLKTPNGSLKLVFDETETSEEAKFEIAGQELNLSDVNVNLHEVLESVPLPDGMSLEELEQFVKEQLGVQGIDIDSSDFNLDVVEDILSEKGLSLKEEN